jgi:hypothetical protein
MYSMKKRTNVNVMEMIKNEMSLKFNVNIHDVLIKREYEYKEVMTVMMISNFF